MKRIERRSAKPVKRKPATMKQSVAPKVARRYELDGVPLTQQQMDQIDRLQPPGRMRVDKSLF
jgi:hypothetical protein